MCIVPKRYSSVFVVSSESKDKSIVDLSSKIHCMCCDYGESNTDKSFFRPDASVKRSALGSGSSIPSVGLYDYPDGVDKGDNIMTILRSKSLDPTEIDALQKRLEQDIELKKKLDSEKELEELRSKSADELREYVKNLSENLTSFKDSNTESK